MISRVRQEGCCRLAEDFSRMLLDSGIRSIVTLGEPKTSQLAVDTVADRRSNRLFRNMMGSRSTSPIAERESEEASSDEQRTG